jgi:alanyl-tRNA synthetase
MAAEQGLTFDWSGFKREMEHHGEVSGSAEKNLLFKHDPLENVKKNNPPTEFVGYNTLHCEAKIIAILADGKLVDSVSEGQTAQIVLDKTPFYGEKGGQVGDDGVIHTKNQKENDGIFMVDATQIDGELIVHTGRMGHSENSQYPVTEYKVGDTVVASVTKNYRQAIERAHTATHLLHYVLRLQLGGHAEQQGSKVDADTLRFDFTNHSAIDKETLQKIELQVNELILQAEDANIHEMSIEEARKTGAMMLFGEKYPEKVRVVGFGNSVELCGGTHLTNTSQVGFFKIISEESVSAGTRRITALTGLKAAEKALHDSSLLQQTAAVLKIPAEDIVQKVEDLTAQVKKLQKDVQSRTRQSAVSAADLLKDAQTVNGIKLITKQVNADVNTLRQLIDQIRQKEQNVAVLLASVTDGKVLLIAGLSRDLTAKKFDAVEWVKSVTPLIGGKGGGGRPDMAQGGGNDAAKLPEVFDAAKKWLEK